MARYLVVAHQTAQSRELLAPLRQLLRADSRAEFVLLVPVTPVGYLLTWEEGETVELAQHRAEVARATLQLAGIPIGESRIGDPSPLRAIEDELHRHRYAAVVICTLPPGLSQWLQTDVPTQVARRHRRLKVIHVVAQPGRVQVNWPRTLAYFVGLAAAVVVEIIEWPIGVLLAAFPLVRLLNRRHLPGAARVAIGFAEDVARPVVGEAIGTAHLTHRVPPVLPPEATTRPRRPRPPQPPRTAAPKGKAAASHAAGQGGITTGGGSAAPHSANEL